MRTQTESEFAEKVCRHLAPHMYLTPEVWSDCGKGRIDYIAECKLTAHRLGIEFKRDDDKTGEGIGKFIRQAIRYSQYNFNGSPIPIFIAPPLSGMYLALVDKRETINGKEYILDRHPLSHAHHTVNGLLGDFNVGEIRSQPGPKDKKYAIFSFSNRIIYSLRPVWDVVHAEYSEDIAGLHQENYTRLMRNIRDWRIDQ